MGSLRRRRCSWLSFAVALTCGHAATAGEPHPSLIGGVEDAADLAVGGIGAAAPGRELQLGCSGTLISPTLVLTAAHCAKYLPSPLRFTTAAVDGRAISVAVAEAHLHPDFTVSTAPVPLHDIALLVLADAITGVTPERLPPPELPPMVGDALDLVGHGARVDGGQGGVRTRAQAHIVAVESAELVVGGAEEPHGCAGDSGGPALANVAGERVLVGVLSRAADRTTRCGPGAVYTRVDAHRDWIARVAATSTHEGAAGSGCALVPATPRAAWPWALAVTFVSVCLRRRRPPPTRYSAHHEAARATALPAQGYSGRPRRGARACAAPATRRSRSLVAQDRM